jgi:hypothetical protein
MSIPTGPAQRAGRPASRTIGAAFIAILAVAILAVGPAFLAGGRQAWQGVAASGLKPQAHVQEAGAVGSCHLNAPNMAAWPDWILQGLRSNRDAQAGPGASRLPAVAKTGDRV